MRDRRGDGAEWGDHLSFELTCAKLGTQEPGLNTEASGASEHRVAAEAARREIRIGIERSKQ